MTEKEIIQKVSEIMEVPFSHYDNHMDKSDYFPHYTTHSPVKIVSYGSKYGPWEFAILEDMSIITPMSRFSDLMLEFADIVENKQSPIDIKTKNHIDTIKKEVECIKASEKFLIENNCADIINDPNKKINWV
jgi:hypothetical protein